MLPRNSSEVEARHDDQPGPRVQGGVEQHRHSVDVEERQHREDHVVGDHPVQRPDLRDVGHQVAVGQHHALGIAGRPELYGSTARCDDGAKLTSRRGHALLHQVGGVGMSGGVLPLAVEHDQVAVGQPDRRGRFLRPAPAAA